ncbi:MAG TPA: hypothetical protein VIL55_04910 [Naasia sp.]|jgi:hypothetical protein
MQAWDAFVQWLSSDAGQTALISAGVPFVAILVGALTAAAISRSGIRRLLRQRDRETAAGVIAALVDAAHDAASWSATSPGERSLAERQAGEAELRLRLLPLQGADAAADWAAHELRQLRRASSAYTADFDSPLAAFRSRLVEWHRKPRRATRAFAADLVRWDSDERTEEQRLQGQQDAWLPPRDLGADSPLLLDRPLGVEAPTATIPDTVRQGASSPS